MPDVEPLRAGDPAAAGPYRLVGRLGAGGHGGGYLGRAHDGRPVVVKLLPEGPADRERLVRALAVARWMEPPSCLARVLDVATGERPYVVREYVDGPTLEQAAPAPAAELPRLAAAVATGLNALHQAGVAHLALKPANVLLVPGGARVADYGIAGSYGTATAGGGGAPAYLAPEQVAGLPGGAPADVFAWGAVVGFAATGTPPFGDGSPAEVAERVLRGEPRLDGLPVPLREVVTACLAKDPAARPTMREVLLRLTGATPAPDDDFATPAATQDFRPPSIPLRAPHTPPPGPHLPHRDAHGPLATSEVPSPVAGGPLQTLRASDTGTLLVRPFAASAHPGQARATAPPADWMAFHRAGQPRVEDGQRSAFVDVLVTGDAPAAPRSRGRRVKMALITTVSGVLVPVLAAAIVWLTPAEPPPSAPAATPPESSRAADSGPARLQVTRLRPYGARNDGDAGCWAPGEVTVRALAARTGGPLTIRYAWLVDGAPAGATASTLIPGNGQRYLTSPRALTADPPPEGATRRVTLRITSPVVVQRSVTLTLCAAG
ncbi:protein kinase [Nonomuraea wenchangensis]|uniref:protein kinase domain-containing protein n=1 Tax=Nonomuraea wenchangensis TaxID=568860 RepID=UPI00384AD0F7